MVSGAVMNTLILLAALSAGQPMPPATFHAPDPVAAKGEVKAGPPLTHTFDLFNNSNGTVTITKVEAGCGCLRQTLAAQVLQPGTQTKLALEVNTLTQPDGPNRWQIAVSYKSDAPGAAAQGGELVLQITANLSRDIAVSPPQVAFSTATEANQVLTVTDKRAKPLTVLKAATSSLHLTADVAAAGGSPRSQSVTLRLLAAAPVGHRDEVVVLYTDDPTCPELRIPVRVQKRAVGGVTATPEAVNLRIAADQKEGSALVQLRAPDGKAVSVSGADSDLPGVVVKHSTGSGPLATVRITIPEGLAAQPGRCTVRVRLETGGEVAIPVSWTGTKK